MNAKEARKLADKNGKVEESMLLHKANMEQAIKRAASKGEYRVVVNVVWDRGAELATKELEELGYEVTHAISMGMATRVVIEW